MDSLKSLLPVTVKDADDHKSTDSSQDGDAGDGSGYFSGWLGETEEDDAWIPSLTRKQRLLAFFGFSAVSIFCFAVSLILLPVIVLKARKFALLFSLGSVCALASLAMLRGPSKFFGFMFSRERWMFSAGYVVSLVLTLYCAMGLRRTVPTVFAASFQFAIIGQCVLGYIPGGTTGVRMLVKLWMKILENTVIPFLKLCIPRLFR